MIILQFTTLTFVSSSSNSHHNQIHDSLQQTYMKKSILFFILCFLFFGCSKSKDETPFAYTDDVYIAGYEDGQ